MAGRGAEGGRGGEEEEARGEERQRGRRKGFRNVDLDAMFEVCPNGTVFV